jgi:hypothetical protein
LNGSQVSTFIHELDSVADQFSIAVVGGDFNFRFGTKNPKMKTLTSALSVYPSLSLSVPSASTFRSALARTSDTPFGAPIGTAHHLCHGAPFVPWCTNLSTG